MNVEDDKNSSSAELHLLRAVANNANDAILVTEAWPVEELGPRIVYINEAFSRMTGYTAEEYSGRRPASCKVPGRSVPGWTRSGRRWKSGSRSG